MNPRILKFHYTIIDSSALVAIQKVSLRQVSVAGSICLYNYKLNNYYRLQLLHFSLRSMRSWCTTQMSSLDKLLLLYFGYSTHVFRPCYQDQVTVLNRVMFLRSLVILSQLSTCLAPMNSEMMLFTASGINHIAICTVKLVIINTVSHLYTYQRMSSFLYFVDNFRNSEYSSSNNTNTNASKECSCDTYICCMPTAFFPICSGRQSCGHRFWGGCCHSLVIFVRQMPDSYYQDMEQ